MPLYASMYGQEDPTFYSQVLGQPRSKRPGLYEGLFMSGAGLMGGRDWSEGMTQGMKGFGQGIEMGQHQASRDMTNQIQMGQLQNSIRKQQIDQETAAKKQQAEGQLANFMQSGGDVNSPEGKALLFNAGMGEQAVQLSKPQQQPGFTPVKVIGPDGKPVFASPQEALGKPAYIEPNAPRNAQTVNMADGVYERGADGAWNKIGDLPPRGSRGDGDVGDGYGGTGLPAQDSNVLLSGKTGDPKYALSFYRTYQPRVINTDTGPRLYTPPIPPNIKPPDGFKGFDAAPGAIAGQPTATPESATAASPVTGGTLSPVMAGGEKAIPAEVKAKYLAGVKGLGNVNDSVDRYDKEIDTITGTDLASIRAGIPTRAGARFSSLHTDLITEMKNLAELGALSGPDMGLMENLLGTPQDLASIKDPQILKAKLGVVKEKLLSARKRLDETYGSAGTTQPSTPQGVSMPVESQGLKSKYGLR